MGVEIVEGKGIFEGECGASHCNQWDGYALCPNYFGEDLLIFTTTFDFQIICFMEYCNAPCSNLFIYFDSRKI